MWRAVILQALIDAASENDRNRHMHDKIEAIYWLISGSPDFNDVCLRAGMEPREVRKQAKKAIANPRIWRRAEGMSARAMERRIRRQNRHTGRHTQMTQAAEAGCLIVYAFS